MYKYIAVSYENLLDPVWGKPLTDAIKTVPCGHILSEAATRASAYVTGKNECPLDRCPITGHAPALEVRRLATRHLMGMIKSGAVDVCFGIGDDYRVDKETDDSHKLALKFMRQEAYSQALPLVEKLISYFPNVASLRYMRMSCHYHLEISQILDDAKIYALNTHDVEIDHLLLFLNAPDPIAPFFLLHVETHGRASLSRASLSLTYVDT